MRSTHKQEGRAVRAPGPGEMRPTRMVEDDPNERSVGIRSRLVAEDVVLFLNLPGAQPVSAPLAAELVCSCHLRSTMPLKNGRARPARTKKKLGVLRQCHVARLYGSAHASAGRASALDHSWRLPFLCRISGHPTDGWQHRVLVFGLLCRHTASNPITAEMHTRHRFVEQDF